MTGHELAGRYRIGPEVAGTEARLVREVLDARGWTAAVGRDCELAWLSSGVTGDGSSNGPPRGARVVGTMPGLHLLERRDVTLLGARRARRRRGLLPEEVAREIPETFAMPRDEEAFIRARLAAPARRWDQRPLRTTADRPRTRLGPGRHPDRHSNWIVEEAVLGHPDGGAPWLVRAFALVASLDPLLAYLLVGDLATNEPQARDGTVTFDLMPSAGTATGWKTVGAPAEAAPLAERIGVLFGDVLTGSREELLRCAPDGGSPAVFQLVAVTVQPDADLEPWLVDIDTSPFDSVMSEEVRRAVVGEVAAAVRLIDPVGLLAPQRAGAFARVVPSRAAAGLDGLALPRPLDLALAATCGGAVETPRVGPAPGLRWWLLGDQIAFFVPTRGSVLITEPASSFIWLGIRDGADAGQIARELASATGAAVGETETRVRTVLGEWVDAGIAVRVDVPWTPPDGSPEFPSTSRVARITWNVDRAYRCLGSAVAVRYPNHEMAAAIEPALEGMILPDATEVDAFCEIERDGNGWRVTGSHFEELAVSSGHQLQAAVRHAVLASGARTSDRLAFFGTALAHRRGVLVVVGDLAARASLVMGWTASGGWILADNLVALEGGRVDSARIGFMLNEAYQWIDGPPPPLGSPGAPVVSLAGSRVRFWFPPSSTMTADPAPVIALVALVRGDGGTPEAVAPAEMLGHLLAPAPVGRTRLTEDQVVTAVGLVGGVPCLAAGADDPRRLARLLGELIPDGAA